MTSTLMQTIPFVEARHIGGKQRPKSILIRVSNTTSQTGAAFGIASAWHKVANNVDSCHYVVDEESTFQCVPDRIQAMATHYGSKNTISINVCAQPASRATDWFDLEHNAVFERTAKLVADISDRYKIPVRDTNWITHHPWFFRGGIIVCVKGAWPTEQFLDEVNIHKK